MQGGWMRDLSKQAQRASLRRASVRRESLRRASQSSIYDDEAILPGSGVGFTRILSRRYDEDLGPTPAFGSSGDTAAEAAAEAREFVQALQAEELDTEKLMHLINTPIPLLRKELSPEHLEHALRFKKTFAKLSPDFAADGILTEAELLEIKTRSWAFYESSSVLGQLDVTSKRSSDIIDTVLANTYRFLRRRSQYLQCFYFVCLIGLLVGVLSLQKDVVEAYKLREAVTTALFPADTFGEKVLLEADTKVASADSIFDWFQQVFLDSDDAVLKDPECGDGLCASPVEFAGWGHGDFQFGCVNDCGSWEKTTNVHVHLSLDPSLPQEDIDHIRWNIYCVDIEIFEKEMSLFPEDQTFDSVSSVYDDILEVIDCTYDLRIYAPVGGVDGYVELLDASNNDTHLLSHEITNIEVSEDEQTVSFHGCQTPLPSESYVIGDVRLCTNSHFTDETQIYFDQESFRNSALIRDLDHYMEDWLRESFVSPIFEDSYSTDCHVCNTSTNITGTQTPCPVHNFDIGWCPDGCEPAPEPDALPDFNNFPCEHNVGVRDGEVVMESIVVAAYKFELVEDKAVCADFQLKMHSSNISLVQAVMDFYEERHESTARNTVVAHEIKNMSGTVGLVNLFELRVNLTELEDTLGRSFTRQVAKHVDTSHQFDTENITTCGQEQERGCVFPAWTCQDAHQYLENTLGIHASCEFLEDEFSCDCRSCDCHPIECVSTGCGGAELTCDDYLLDTCAELEETGCDCSGCDCAVDSCHKSCHGLSCDDIMHMGDDDALFGRYFGHATCSNIEEQYGCDCSGCSRCEEDDRVDLIRDREAAELDEYFPFHEVFCAPGCDIELLINGVCDAACHTSSCLFDEFDCCVPSYDSRNPTLHAFHDTVLTFRVKEYEDAHPMKDPSEPVHRFLAGKHMILAGLLISQTRHASRECHAEDLSELSEQSQPLAHAEDCIDDGVYQTEEIGIDPFFVKESHLYDPHVNLNYCYPGKDIPHAFPYVKYPEVTCSAFKWNECAEEIRSVASDPAFFGNIYEDEPVPAPSSDLHVDSVDRNGGRYGVGASTDGRRRLSAPNPSPGPLNEMHEETLENTAQGTYPVFFDVNFDEDRSRKMIDVVRDGFYIEPTHTAGVDVQFLLFHQESDMITYVDLAYTLEESGSVFVHKNIEVFAVNPYGTGTDHRIILEGFFIFVYFTEWMIEIFSAVNLCQVKSVRAYLFSVWSYIDLTSNLLILVSIFYWLDSCSLLTSGAFQPKQRYEVYNIRETCPDAHWLRFNHTELTDLRITLDMAKQYVERMSEYSSLNVANIVLMLLRLLHYMHFQPQLGVVTRTVGRAASDMVHFFILFFIVVISYSFLSHLIFGATIEQFSTFGLTMQTMVNVLLGRVDIGAITTEMHDTSGSLFFYSYIVLGFLILLNMLLAIILDAYSVVKSTAMASQTLSDDMKFLFNTTVREWKRPKDVMRARDLHLVVDAWMGSTEEVLRQTMMESINGKPFLEVDDHKVSRDALRGIIKSYVDHHIKVENMPPEAKNDVDEVVDSIMYHYAKDTLLNNHLNKGKHLGTLTREFSGLLTTNAKVAPAIEMAEMASGESPGDVSAQNLKPNIPDLAASAAHVLEWAKRQRIKKPRSRRHTTSRSRKKDHADED